MVPVAIENALYVIWAYINNFQFGGNFPDDIEVHQSVLSATNIPSRGVYEWELALLAREVLVHGQEDISYATKNFNRWDYFGGSINKIKEFENNAWPIIGSGENLRHELRRIAHRQFPWQQKVSSVQFVRYFKIYNNPRVAGIIQNKIGLSVQEWYTVGTAVLGAFLNHHKMNVCSAIEIAGLQKRHFDIFFEFTSAKIDKLRGVIEKELEFNDEYVYTLNPLEYYPLIQIGAYYYCPVINFLAWRITSGLYFDMVNDGNFGHAFGISFQDYIEEISNVVIDKSRTKVIPEQKYKVGKNEKDGIDTILSQDDAAFFVEVKAKRMLARSKSQLLSDSAIDRDLNILADDIVQVYATVQDYKNNLYTNFAYNKDTKIFPLVVTLEDWFLIGEDSRELKNKVIKKLEENDLPTNFLKETPYIICSCKNYEQLIQVLNKHSISEIMEHWVAPEKEGHNFGQFLATNYRDGCKFIDDFFPGDFEKIYPQSLR